MLAETKALPATCPKPRSTFNPRGVGFGRIAPGLWGVTMSSPAYIPSLSTWKNRRMRDSRDDVCARAKHCALNDAAIFLNRRPQASWCCPGTNTPMWASACADRQRCAYLVPVLAEQCGKCPRGKKEGDSHA